MPSSESCYRYVVETYINALFMSLHVANSFSVHSKQFAAIYWSLYFNQ